MNRWITRLRRSALWIGTAVLVASTAVDAWAAEKRLALVVGNARYPSAPLNNPENDAHVVAATLRRLGFEVLEHVNLPVKDFRRVLREYSKRVQDSDGTALFFYAGHGVQIDGRNYLLPVDINVRDELEIKDEAVDIDELFVSRLERARAQVRIIILDACRDNPFGTKTRGLRTVGTGLVEMGARGALIAYSSAPGATAEDGPPGTNSVFTRHMVKEMLVEGLEVEQMFKNVRVKVLRDTNQRQIPWLNSSMIANFSFNPRTGGDAPEGARREDLAKLQASLDKREREQKELEEKVKRLSRELEQAQAQAAASKPVSVAAPPAATSKPVTAAVAPPAASKPAAVAVAPPAASKPEAVAVAPLAASKPAAVADAPPVASKPAAVAVAPPAASKPEAVAVAPPAASKPAVAAVPPPAVAKAPPFVLPTAPTGAGPLETKSAAAAKAALPKLAPPPKTEAKVDAKSEPKTAPAEVKFAQAPTPAPKAAPPGRKSEGNSASERCVALLIRAQLGEQLAPSEMSYLQKECR